MSKWLSKVASSSKTMGSVEGRPLPSCLVLGFIADEPIHAVLAIDKDFDRIFIITIYRPSRERWQDDWRNRKN